LNSITRRVKYQKSLAIGALLIAVAFLIIGNLRVHKVYDADTEQFGIQAFHKISERQLVEDATFSGVLRKGLKLYSTYDRSQAGGKRACPT
jgi:hypothetical protein